MRATSWLRVGLWACTCLLWASDVGAQDAPAAAPEEAASPAAPEAAEDAVTAEGEPAAADNVESPDAADAYADMGGADEISEADLAAFVDQSQLDEMTSGGPSLRVYGFADFSVVGVVDRTPAREAFRGPGTNLYIGNLNLYLDADLTHGVRSLAEIRFTYLPNGNITAEDRTRVATNAFDYADSTRTFQWGGIEIERAWVEYAAHDLFVIRAGQYLTPYGIWNVDHATPTIIPTLRPYVVGEALFPERQVGFQAYGSYALGMATLGYHVTLSNGRGNVQYIDFDRNKAVGGRLFVELDLRELGTLRVGVSGYAGRRTDALVTIEGTSLTNEVAVQWDEFSYAGDLLWKVGGLHVQFEGIASDVRFTNQGRYTPIFGAPATGRLADYRRWGAYGLVGYRTPWAGLMPYAMVSVFRPGAPAPVDLGPSFFDTVEYSAGLNMRPIPALALKLQYTATTSDPLVSLDFLEFPKVEHSLAGQIAWSF